MFFFFPIKCLVRLTRFSVEQLHDAHHKESFYSQILPKIAEIPNSDFCLHHVIGCFFISSFRKNDLDPELNLK